MATFPVEEACYYTKIGERGHNLAYKVHLGTNRVMPRFDR
jgi:hypothetical protein